ncbi:MAG: serpin family protein [Tepidisphaerales bacterium]
MQPSRRSLIRLFMAAVIVAPAYAADGDKPSLSPFTVEMYRQLAAGDANAFFSPSSIAQAVAMLREGARGETADEILKALQLSPDGIKTAFDPLDRLAAGDNPAILLSNANSAWVEQTFPLRKDFADTLQSRYSAADFNCDFKGKPDVERIRINQWVEKQTHDRIKDLIAPGLIDPAARLILANAIYFKATWQNPFEARATSDQDFTLADGAKVKAKLMSRGNTPGGFYQDEQLQLLDLPYKGGSLAMFIILPRQHDGLAAIEKDLTGKKLDELAAKVKSGSGLVQLPRFKFEVKYELNAALQAIGVRRAFVFGQADLTGVSDSTEAKLLYVSQAIHKAFVEVNEEGTEAAAATALVLRSGGAPRPPANIFRADHPFLFLIRDTKTGAVLFMGRMSDPTK